LRAVFLALEFALIFAIYYGYGLISEAEIPLYILTIVLIITDRSIDAVRTMFERRIAQHKDDA
jgi:hypothetical protein